MKLILISHTSNLHLLPRALYCSEKADRYLLYQRSDDVVGSLDIVKNLFPEFALFVNKLNFYSQIVIAVIANRVDVNSLFE